MVTVYELLIGLGLIGLCAFAGGIWRRAGGSRLTATLLTIGALGAYAGPILWRTDWTALAGPLLGLAIVATVVGGYALLLRWIRRRAGARGEEDERP